MNHSPADSPYPLGTVVTGPKLLQIRHAQIELALRAVAAERPPARPHALVLGAHNSGRTSVLKEVCRRAAAERGRLIVRLENGYDAPRDRPGLVSHLLTGIVRAIAAAQEVDPAWHRAWKHRILLRSTDPPTADDRLCSALAYAVDPKAELDRNIFEGDLEVLLEIARESGFSGIVVSIDDASPLTEDVRLIEYLVDVFDEVGGYSLLLAGLPSIDRYFKQAASPCLERCELAELEPFRNQHQIFTALSAPLSGSATEFLRADRTDLLSDILQLTGGNPYEVMIVGNYLWESCQLGEHDTYKLTSKVLDRVVPALSQLVAKGEALRDGAAAIDRLPEQQVRQAVELVAFSGLSVREATIARLLGVGHGSEARINPEANLGANFAEEEERVRADLLELQEAGVVELNEDRFRVIGGSQAAVVLKYKARARIGAETSNLPFGRDFLSTTGWALAREAMLRTLERLPEGSRSLGVSEIRSQGVGLGRLSAREAIDRLRNSDSIDRLVEAEIDLDPWNADAYEAIAGLLTREEPHVALVCHSLSYGSRKIEYVEVWELPASVTENELTAASVSEDWQSLVRASGLKWEGIEHVLLSGRKARRALIAIHRFASSSAVQSLFEHWRQTGQPTTLECGLWVAKEAVGVMRESGKSDFELDGELSAMLSRLGFLRSLDDERLRRAREALEDALRAGMADTWVTHWVLANVLARLGEPGAAIEQLQLAEKAMEDWCGNACVAVYVPGRPVADSIVTVTEEGIQGLLELQRALIEGSSDDVADAANRCLLSDDPGAVEAADWVGGPLVPLTIR